MKSVHLVTISVIVSVVVVLGILAIINQFQTTAISEKYERYDEYLIELDSKDEYYMHEAENCATNEQMHERDPCMLRVLNESYNYVKGVAEKHKVDNDTFNVSWNGYVSNMRFAYQTTNCIPIPDDYRADYSQRFNERSLDEYLKMLQTGYVGNYLVSHPDVGCSAIDCVDFDPFQEKKCFYQELNELQPFGKVQITLKELEQVEPNSLKDPELTCQFFDIIDSDICERYQ